MAMKTPRPRPNEPIRAAHFNALADAIDSCKVNVGPGSGLGMHQGPNGTDLWAVKPPDSIKTGYTTSIVNGASGGTLGSGTGVLTWGVTDDLNIPGGTPQSYTFYSNDTEEVHLNAYVVLVRFRDGYMIIHARCGDLG